MGRITIFKNIHSTSNPFHRDIMMVLERIKDGSSKDKIEQIRKCKTKEERNRLKKELPSICFSGIFKVRKKDACLEHSGFICLDFDSFETKNDRLLKKEHLENDPYTFSVFTSPSGDGLKVVVKIPPSIEHHEAYFESLKDYYNCPHFDISTKDISRVCYESYDPEIFINENSLLWDKKNEIETYNYSEKIPTLPVRNSSQIISNLQKWIDDNFPIIEGQRNANLYKFASALNDYGVPEFEARTYLERYETKGFSAREIANTVKSAYSKSANHGSKYFEDTKTKQYIKEQVRSGKDSKRIIKEANIKEEDFENVLYELESKSTVSEFWYFDEKGKCLISNVKFKHFLEQNGFYKYYPQGGDSFIFIRLENSFVENTTPAHIKDFVLDYLLKQETLKPYELMAGATKYFKEDYLSFIKSEQIHIYEDSEEFAMLYFQNCAVKVFKDRIEKIDYLNLDGMVWKDHVIQRDYEKIDFNNCYFDRFIGKVANEEGNRKNALMAVIGYLMHSHKTSANNKAIIFNDEMISENPNGGSGKGIICNAIGKLKRACILDGKQFDFNKSFAYQTVSIDTQILIFDDVKKNFPFEGLFSLITEGITLEKKNKDAIKIPVTKSPKILITTNYTVGGVGGSFERRKYEVELSSYFSSNHTPFEEFGIMLFDDFDKLEWQRFDNFMISCLQLYLKNGLVKHSFHNLKTRKFINDTSFDFYEWVLEGNIELGQRVYKTDKFNEFVEEYPDYKKFNLSQKRFSKWLDALAVYLDKDLQSGKSINGRWVIIGEENEPTDYWDNIKIENDNTPF
ncbi:MAG: BT4734/BF3469 family protein [Bacteroidales bacterium]|jgi:hypothetical protein|nr:BT4734/BF3469 family protein [Bacteroidales bacterium]